MNLVSTQPIKTERLLLRRYTMDDVEAMYTGWASDPQVEPFVQWPLHTSRDVTQHVLQDWTGRYDQPGYFHWGIELNGQLIGDIAVVEASSSHRYAEVGYCLRPADWGKGITTEALNGVLRFLFDIVGLHRVYLRHDTRNVASGRVMQKNGLMHEGTLRQHYRRKDGTFGDVAVYGILHEEWISRTTPDGKDL